MPNRVFHEDGGSGSTIQAPQRAQMFEDTPIYNTNMIAKSILARTLLGWSPSLLGWEAIATTSSSRGAIS